MTGTGEHPLMASSPDCDVRRLRGDGHEPCEALAICETATAGRFALIEQSLTVLKQSMSSIESSFAARDAKSEARDSAASVASAAAVAATWTRRLWAIAQVIGIVMLVGIGLLEMRDRLLTVELAQSSSREALGRLEKQIDAIASRLGVPTAPRPSP